MIIKKIVAYISSIVIKDNKTSESDTKYSKSFETITTIDIEREFGS
jgi:hypothetical protein